MPGGRRVSWNSLQRRDEVMHRGFQLLLLDYPLLSLSYSSLPTQVDTSQASFSPV